MMERLLEADRNLAVGLLDRAESIFRQLADADPRNAVAVVGLARCALERGDERAAYELIVRALTIDPEDGVALRTEARLSEVLAARGHPVDRPAFVLAAPPAPGPGSAARSTTGGAAGGTAGAATAAGGDEPRRRSLLGRILRRG